MLPCEVCQIFKNNYFVEHLRTAASDGSERDDIEMMMRVLMKV